MWKWLNWFRREEVEVEISENEITHEINGKKSLLPNLETDVPRFVETGEYDEKGKPYYRIAYFRKQKIDL